MAIVRVARLRSLYLSAPIFHGPSTGPRLDPERDSGRGINASDAHKHGSSLGECGIRRYVAVRKDDIERPVFAEQHSSQHILFGVESIIPFRRIIKRQTDIVNMNQNSGRKTWQDLQEEYRDVRIGEDAVRSVEKKNIISL